MMYKNKELGVQIVRICTVLRGKGGMCFVEKKMARHLKWRRANNFSRTR